MRWTLLLLLLLPTALRAGEDQRIFFLEPDRAARREIERRVSSKGKGIGSSTTREREAAREEILALGPWSVPFLADALLSRRQAVRVRQNAALLLALIDDVRAPDALRAAARDDDSPFVRIPCCLGLGHYGREADAEALAELLDDRDDAVAAAAALGLARLPGERATRTLATRARDLPDRRPVLAAALLLGATLRDPEFDAALNLQSEQRLVAGAAAVSLLLRPSTRHAGTLLELLGRPERDEWLRALHVMALAALPQRTEELSQRLVDLATRSGEHRGVRTAALIGLAGVRGYPAHARTLIRELRGITGRNDPLVAPLLFALARSGDGEALEAVLRQARAVREGRRPFYAAGSLLFEVCTPLDGALHPRADEVLAELADLSVSEEDELYQLKDIARFVRAVREPDERERRCREQLADDAILDPLHLWDSEREQRDWRRANEFLYDLFGLDQIAERGDPMARVESQKIQGGSNSGNAPKGGAAGKPEEQDLYWFLDRRPYFTPEVAGGR